MVIGIDDDEFVDELETTEQSNSEDQAPQTEEISDAEPSQEEDFLTSYLKSKGIKDKSKIKFENEEGVVEEADWNNLSNQDKLNILRSSEEQPETGLDGSEIQLINAIRTSGLTPSEYLNYISDQSVQSYIQNAQQPQYEIDQYSDDELFLMDLMSRMGSITEEEATDALERAKANEGLFKKQVEAIRNEYKQAEQENQMQAQLEQDQFARQEYEQFSNKIVDEINNLTEIQGFDLNMSDEDMQQLYDFITGHDAAGANYMTKALADPKILVKMAWLALNGDQMVNDITSYFQREIASVRKESYKKGVEDTQKKINNQNNVVFMDNSKSKKETFTDLDDF